MHFLWGCFRHEKEEVQMWGAYRKAKEKTHFNELHAGFHIEHA